MHAARTLPSLALTGVLALGAAACGDDTDPAGESGEQQRTDEMTDEDMTEERMTDEDMTEEQTTDEMTDEG